MGPKLPLLVEIAQTPCNILHRLDIHERAARPRGSTLSAEIRSPVADAIRNSGRSFRGSLRTGRQEP
jgi:hypothetical protein